MLPQHWPLDKLLKVARDADWLPYRLPGKAHDITPVDALGSDVGDAVYFLKKLRNLAAHPGAPIADEQLSSLNFSDDAMMRGMYQALKGIAGAVRDKLYEVIE